jgi:hypothetical protein
MSYYTQTRNRLKCFLLFAVAVLLVSLLTFVNAQVIKNFRYPDYDEDGNLNFEVTGAKGHLETDDLIKITDLKVTLYSKQKISMILTSPFCLYDKNTHTAESTSLVHMARNNIIIEGQDYFCNIQNKKFTIKKKAKVIVKTSE